MNMQTLFYRTTGVIGKAIELNNKKISDKEHNILNKTPFSSCLFQPFKSPIDPLVSVGAIATTPMAFGLLACWASIQLLYNTSKGLVHLLTLYPSDALKAWDKAWDDLIVLGVAIALVVISPLVQLVDFIGSIIKTIANAIDPIQEEPEFNPAP